MKTGKVLVAEDQGTIRKIIGNMLEGHYKFDLTENGLIAWTLLEKNPDDYNVVVLDREMPEMNGMEVLEQMKMHDQLKAVPVIFQTSLTAENEILEGLEAGAYYYLTKPFNEEQLLSIVKGAYSDFERYKAIQDEVRKNAGVLHMLSFMTKGNMAFQYRTIGECEKLASLLANTCPAPEAVVTGLMELLLNAVEHGNLNISYEEKSELVSKDGWLSEVERRLELPENASKKVDVHFKRTEKEITFYIRDRGKGFDWEEFLEFSTGERAFDNHGRGIAMANKLSFDSVEYIGNGSKVLCTKKIENDGN
jgi:DNA-binding response OmpR family regulator